MAKRLVSNIKKTAIINENAFLFCNCIMKKSKRVRE